MNMVETRKPLLDRETVLQEGKKYWAVRRAQDDLDPRTGGFDLMKETFAHADGVDPETVTEVYQKGYRLNGRVLRPSMVKVAN